MNNRLALVLFGLVALLGIVGISSAAFVSGSIPLHVGQNVSSGPWTVQLQDLANIGSNTNAPAAIAVYYNRVQTNETTIAQGQTAPINVNGNLLYVYMNSSFSGTYAYQKWASIVAWYNTTTTYVGQNVTSGPWAVQLQDLAQTANGINAPAALAIYYNGNLANETVANPGTISEFSSPTSPITFSTLYLELNSTYSGLYAYQKWAKLEAWYSPAIVSTTFVEAGLPSGATFTVTFDNQSQSTLTSISNSITFTQQEAAPPTNATYYSIPVVYANATFYTPKVPPFSPGSVVIVNFTPYVPTTTTTVPPTRNVTTTFREIGLPTGSNFTLTLAGINVTSKTESVTVSPTSNTMIFVTNGSYGSLSPWPVYYKGQEYLAEAPAWDLGTTTVITYIPVITAILSQSPTISNGYPGTALTATWTDYANTITPFLNPPVFTWELFKGSSPNCANDTTVMTYFSDMESPFVYDIYTPNVPTYYCYVVNDQYGSTGESPTVLVNGIKVVTTTFMEIGLPKGANFTVTFDSQTQTLPVGPGVTNMQLYFYTSSTANGSFTTYNVVYKGVTYDATVLRGGSITPGSRVMVQYKPEPPKPKPKPTTTTVTTTIPTTTTTVIPTVVTKFNEAGLPRGANFTVTFDGQTKSVSTTVSTTLTFSTPKNANGGYTIYNTVYGGITYDASLAQKGLITPGSIATVVYTPVRVSPAPPHR